MIITDKASKFKRKITEHSTESWVFKYLSWSIPIILVISIICMLFVPPVNQLVTYPEQSFEILEQEAEAYIENLKSIPQPSNLNKFEIEFKDTSIKYLSSSPVVKLTITDYGTENEDFKIYRHDNVFTHILGIATTLIIGSLLLSFAFWGLYLGILSMLSKLALFEEKKKKEKEKKQKEINKEETQK